MGACVPGANHNHPAESPGVICGQCGQVDAFVVVCYEDHLSVRTLECVLK